MKISLFDLGLKGPEMLENWSMMKKEHKDIKIKEFATVDPFLKIEGTNQELMDFILSIVIQTEQRKREHHKFLQRKGIEKARETGVLIGRKPLEIPKQFYTLYHRIKNKEMYITKAARILRVDYKTVKKWVILKDEGKIQKSWRKDRND